MTSCRRYGTTERMEVSIRNPAEVALRDAPFGLPVVPDVWMTILGEPGSRACAG